MQHSPGFLQLVEEARKDVRELSVDEVLALPAHVALIDVREDSEWVLGHLPRAQHLSKGIIERDIEQRFALDQALVLYCGGGFRSILAAQNLRKMGYTQVFSMAGGYRAWTERRLPLDVPKSGNIVKQT